MCVGPAAVIHITLQLYYCHIAVYPLQEMETYLNDMVSAINTQILVKSEEKTLSGMKC